MGKGLTPDWMFRRIGTGVETKIWGYPWFPDSSNHYIETDIIPELARSNVGSLMKVHSREWDENLIDLFSPRDIDVILQIPLFKL